MNDDFMDAPFDFEPIPEGEYYEMLKEVMDEDYEIRLKMAFSPYSVPLETRCRILGVDPREDVRKDDPRQIEFLDDAPSRGVWQSPKP